jgi:spore maturation protein CgeB
MLKFWRPDLLFVESAWHGPNNAWKFKIASYPDYPKRTNEALRRVIEYARELAIPCVFWNKEDGVHFERFIASAALFDTIFTVDLNCVERYRSRIDREVLVAPLMFAAQPAIHNFSGIGTRQNRSCFVGSYSRHLHDLRRERQDMLLSAAASMTGLTAFDRNSNRKSANYRYPEYSGIEVRKSVPHHHTADIYKNFMISLNFNTIDDSETMFSRRLIEIIACGGLAVTTPALSIEKHFKDYCYVVDSPAAAVGLLSRLKSGYGPKELEMMGEGAKFVLKNHTYAHRIETILNAVK